MKSFRGQPSIYAPTQHDEIRAELVVKNLSLSFGGIMALNQIDLKVGHGELLAIIGPNGAGKTSLLNCITGYYRPQNGRILFNGKNITGLRPHEITRLGVGRTFQNIELFPGMSIISNMLLARHVHCQYNLGLASLFSPSVKREEVRQRRVVEELIDFLELQPIRKKFVGSLPYVMSISKRVMVLDFGEKITEGPPEFVQRHPDVIKAYLGDTGTV
jgi:branched-chain amino acid transport system ATP-binding protein